MRLIAGPRRRAGAVLLALLAAGCVEPETVPLGPLMAEGDFMPFGGAATLTPDAGERERPAFWRPAPAVPIDGWGRALHGWRPVGARSTLDLWRRGAGAGDLVFELRRRRNAEASVEVTAVVNGETVGVTAVGPGRTRGRHKVPAAALAAVNRVELRFDPPLRQEKVGAVALSLTRIGFESSGRRPDRWGEREPSVVVDAEASGLTFPRSGAWVMPLAVPPAASRLVYEIRVPAAADGAAEPGPWIWALDAAGRRYDFEPTGKETRRPGWAERAISLEELRGRNVFLGIEAEVPETSARPAIRGLRLGLERAGSEPPPAAADSAAGPRPNVVLIVLDAARADRFDGRYPRDLTPNIDRLGPESLAFEYAYSDCPNTVCSIPNLITGRSLLDTGDVYSGVKLDDQLVTLAESLQAAGYRTIGLSANPNNSAARNQHQGFDDWRELWGREHRDALEMSELAAEIVADQPTDRPLFLQLHYLPPHQPYAPPPEFDLYTDPGYRGPIQPGVPPALPDVGPGTLAPADLEQLIALYDGNVRLADAAVGRVLEALRTAGRWDNTLLILTSDHGEAFMEHGYHGHNSTLFDEMLHVPLVFRLPGGEVGDGSDTRRLAALSDVVPTVLGYLRLDPPPGIDGLDLLRTRVDPLRPRVIYHRTNHKRPLLAAHSRGWKLIVRPGLGAQMLFDLSGDPGETVNLAAARPRMYAGFGLLLRRQLNASVGRAVGAKPVELSEDERAVLESLGYVD